MIKLKLPEVCPFCGERDSKHKEGCVFSEMNEDEFLKSRPYED